MRVGGISGVGGQRQRSSAAANIQNGTCQIYIVRNAQYMWQMLQYLSVWNSILTGSVLLRFEDVDRAFGSWSFGHLLKNAKAGWRAARPRLTTWRFMTHETPGR